MRTSPACTVVEVPLEVEMSCWHSLREIADQLSGRTSVNGKENSGRLAISERSRGQQRGEHLDKVRAIRGGRIRYLLVAGALLLACLPSIAGAKDEFRFDPGKCKKVDGDLYLALGDLVLHLPWSSSATYFLNSIPPQKQRASPDASEQSGCFGNPLQVWMFGSLSGSLWKAAETEPRVAVTLFWNWKPESGSSIDKSEWRGEDLGLHALRRRCAKATSKDILSNGLKACRVEPINPPNIRVEDWATTYNSDPKQYATPLGRPLIVDCGPGIFSTLIGDCKVHYTFTPALGVKYEFNPYHGAEPLSIDAVIGFDTDLRQHINAAIVQEYQWPGPLEGRTGSSE